MEAMKHYTDRELSWTAFNERVLQEASNPAEPLLERMKFLSIVSSNLDEFFMVRVAGLRDEVRSGAKAADPAGRPAKERLHALRTALREQVAAQYRVLQAELLPQLSAQGIRLLQAETLTDAQRAFAAQWFDRALFPALTPMAADPGHPLPLLPGKALNLAVLLAAKDGHAPRLAVAPLPQDLPRLLALPAEDGSHPFLPVEEVLRLCAARLFRGREVLACAPFRITRSAAFRCEEKDAADLPRALKKSLKQRREGEVIRLEWEQGTDAALRNTLEKALGCGADERFLLDGPLDLTFLMKELHGLAGLGGLRYRGFEPRMDPRLADPDLFRVIREKDLFFFHPYDSFAPVVRFVQQAAEDVGVLAIKQTLYRVSSHSPIIAALCMAAQRGKQVTVLMEVKARFDEENNLRWGETLEQAGCHVVYGLAHLKTHSKITLVVRREQGTLMRYVHLATGNYHDGTARLYTDMGILTADPVLCEDAANFFSLVTGYSEFPPFHALTAAPAQLRGRLTALIRREAEHARQGRPALIEAKMNALVDPALIRELYDASAAGVRIDLTVRGICCLQPGVKGVSENITVRSIVGRFLEHARVFRFENGGRRELYLSSADWMPRNLDRRVELMFPIRDEAIAKRVEDILRAQQQDTANAWLLRGDSWTPRRKNEPLPLRCTQEELIP